VEYESIISYVTRGNFCCNPGLEIGKTYGLPNYFFLAGQINYGLPFPFWNCQKMVSLKYKQNDSSCIPIIYVFALLTVTVYLTISDLKTFTANC
jgi:hypothetical protein